MLVKDKSHPPLTHQGSTTFQRDEVRENKHSLKPLSRIEMREETTAEADHMLANVIWALNRSTVIRFKHFSGK